jgi:DNA-binding NarL/FixJ family response regulator
MHLVILADDHPLLLRSLKDVISADPDFRVVGATTSGTKALSLIRSHQPNLAVLDVSMPDVGGLDILRTVYEYSLPVKVIFLTATLTGRQIADAMAMGIRGLLLKEYATETLLDCMRKVAGGEKWLPSELVARATHDTRSSGAERLSQLTTREREIANLICAGLSNRSIAGKLGTSEGTIRIHLHNMYQKLNISNRTALAALHFEHRAERNG